MSKVTSKRQVSIPKQLADRYGIRPGDEIAWIPAGGEIRVIPGRPGRARTLGPAERLVLFDRASERRDRRREGGEAPPSEPESDRGWTRDELNRRGGPG